MMNGPWIETLSGKQYHLLEPDPAVINIKDIARALAYTCRYVGHCTRFYSVAEHCIHLCNFAPPEQKLLALLHDAHEAYCGDVSSPLKRAIIDLSPYGVSPFDQIERLAQEATEEALGVAARWTEYDRKVVSILDKRICGDEKLAIKHSSPFDWPEPLGISHQIATFDWQNLTYTEDTFLFLYRRYSQ
jgi:uncharacterized protein